MSLVNVEKIAKALKTGMPELSDAIDWPTGPESAFKRSKRRRFARSW